MGNILDSFKSFEVLSFASMGGERNASAQFVRLEGQLHSSDKLDFLRSMRETTSTGTRRKGKVYL